MDSASDHSVKMKTTADDGTQVMTSVSPVQLIHAVESGKQQDEERTHVGPEHAAPYRLYKRRFVGLVGLVLHVCMVEVWLLGC